MDIAEKWEGESNENKPFIDTNSNSQEESFLKKIGQRFFGIFIAFSIGIYAGIICRTIHEAWIYAALFCGEALLCILISGAIKTYSIKKIISTFSLYFTISALTTPVTCWINFKFF